MIRACLFDLGNVLVFFSHDRMCEQLGRLGGCSSAEMRRLLLESGVQWDYERGRLAPEQFHEWFESATHRTVSPTDLFSAGADIFWPNEAILPVLDRLRDLSVRLVLLSNTCQTHFEWVAERFECLKRFDAHVTSYRAGAVKPEVAIYQAALQEIDCSPDECFYTDDIPAYVAAGREQGLHAEVFTDVPSLVSHLQRLGVDV